MCVLWCLCIPLFICCPRAIPRPGPWRAIWSFPAIRRPSARWARSSRRCELRSEANLRAYEGEFLVTYGYLSSKHMKYDIDLYMYILYRYIACDIQYVYIYIHIYRLYVEQYTPPQCCRIHIDVYAYCTQSLFEEFDTLHPYSLSSIKTANPNFKTIPCISYSRGRCA